MAIPASQMKVGNVIKFEDDLWIVVDTQHVKLSKGGGAMQTKLKNLTRGDHITYRFRSSDKVETAFLEKRDCEYLYPEGEGFVFMDLENYEQYNLHQEMVGEQMKFVRHNAKVNITFYEGKPINVALPASVELKVTHTEPGVRGDTVSNVFKPAERITNRLSYSLCIAEKRIIYYQCFSHEHNRCDSLHPNFCYRVAIPQFCIFSFNF